MRALALLLLGTLSAQGAELSAGSKKFTESVILGEVAVQAARAAGVEADHRRELGGTRILFEALLAGEIGHPRGMRQELAKHGAVGDGPDAQLPRRVGRHGTLAALVQHHGPRTRVEIAPCPR